MTVYEELIQAKAEAERIIDENTRNMHNEPLMQHYPGWDLESSMKIYTMMIEHWTRRIKALSAAIDALPDDVAVSKV